MKIELRKLNLDNNNPRFLTSFGAADEEKDIYDYMKKY